MIIELSKDERAIIHKALLQYNLKELTEKEKEIITDLIVKIYK
jgi:hypothetical protein